MKSVASDAGERIVKLQGAHNFRDLGGYVTQSGGVTIRGMIFRSGALSKLSLQDHEVIQGLGIQTIYDLRSNEERMLRPSILPANMPIEIWTREYTGSAGDLMAKIANTGGTAEMARQLMIEAYRILAYEQAPAYQALLNRLAAGALPALIHCSAGKDRTGIAAALLLEILGVPRETIIDDYLLTELFFEQGLEIALNAMGSTALHGVSPAIWEPMMRAERVYIETFFKTLEARHGSVSGYLQEVLEVNEAVLEQLRARFVIDLTR